MPQAPRLTPLPDDEWDDAVRHALSPLLPSTRATPQDAGNVLATLVRHPGLTRGYLEFNAHLLARSSLSPRVREVALLRAVQLCHCGYLWDHHLPLAERAGLTAAQIEEIRDGAPTDPLDRLVVRVVDELDEFSTLPDGTWFAVAEHFDEQQVLDLIFTIGCYRLLAVAVNALAIQPEDH